MTNILNSLEYCIGNTPIVELIHPFIPEKKHLYLKLEYFNPNFSIKDRTALGLVQSGIKKGLLKPGGTLIESTSGNLGKSLAMLGAMMKFNVILIMDSKVSATTVNWCQAYGAEVRIINMPDKTGGYQQARINAVQELLSKNSSYYWPNQYDNLDNKSFHYHTTALEVAQHNFDVVVGSTSTGGHLSGIAAKLKSINYSAEILACDIKGSKIFSDQFRPYLLNGLGLAWRSKNTDLSVINKYCIVNDNEAISICRTIAKDAGILLGGSGGVAVFAALCWLYQHAGNTAIAIIPDSGVNYLDQFYDNNWLAEHYITPLQNAELLEKILSKKINSIINKETIGE